MGYDQIGLSLLPRARFTDLARQLFKMARNRVVRLMALDRCRWSSLHLHVEDTREAIGERSNGEIEREKPSSDQW